MSKIEVVYGKGGRRQFMARRYADTLFKLGHVTYVNPADAPGYKAATPPPPPEPEPRISQAAIDLAAEHEVDLDAVSGTGKDGRITKADVEAVIAAKE